MKQCFKIIFFLGIWSGIYAQQKIKIKKEDNRFLLFKMGEKNDLIIKDQSDLFFIKLPDSIKQISVVTVENGRLSEFKSDSIFKFTPIKGMKYAHAFKDTTFEVLLEGVCPPSNTIYLEVINTRTKKSLLQNKFLAK